MFGTAAITFAFTVDQVTKAVVVSEAMLLRGGLHVFPGFDLVFLKNDGISFGLLGGVSRWGLIALALGVCGWLTSMLIRADSRTEGMAFGLIIGGALGNIADRLRHGAVIDFLDFYVGSAHWPAFNMADVSVVGGVLMLLFTPMIRSWLARKA